MIYCVEDDEGIRNMVVYTLNASGFEACGFEDGKGLFAALANETPELLLLDIMLPGEDGITILKKLRAENATKRLPVIMATAKGTEYDKVIGLDLGADDYLCKPFGMMEMVSRVKAVLRRCMPKEENEVLTLKTLLLNHGERSVKIDGEAVSLTVKEYELLRFLLRNRGKVFSRDQLMSEIWGENFMGESRTVDVHIGTLRAKIGRYGECLQTVRGFGYKIEESV